MPEEYEPPLINEPLTVHVTNGEVVIDGDVPGGLVLSRDAAMETGIALISAAMEGDDATPEQPSA